MELRRVYIVRVYDMAKFKYITPHPSVFLDDTLPGEVLEDVEQGSL